MRFAARSEVLPIGPASLAGRSAAPDLYACSFPPVEGTGSDPSLKDEASESIPAFP